VHEVEPVNDVYVPTAQFVQVVAPVAVLYDPTPHPVQYADPVVVAVVPAGQDVQLDAALPENFPTAQLIHEAAPVAEA
jgi:hypothetical protein